MRRRRIAGIAAGAVLLAAGALYVAGHTMTNDTVPNNASVGGVPIGGLSRVDAIALLTTELADQAGADVELTVDGTPDDEQVTVNPEAAGLGIDYAASVDLAGTGRSWDPRRIIEVLRGGGPHEPVITIDQARMTAAVVALAEKTDTRATDASVGYRVTGTKVTVQTKAGVDAVTLNQPAAPAAIVQAYQQSAPGRLPTTVAEPDVTTAEAKQVADAAAAPAVAAAVTVKIAESGTFRLAPAAIAAATTFPAVDGTPKLTVDPKILRAQAEGAIDDLDLSEPVDAEIEFRDGKPTVIPSKDGVTIAAGDLAAAVTPALTQTDDQRTVTVTSSGAKATFSTADAEKLKVSEVVGEFTTPFPYAEYRNINLGLAAKKINNTLVKPKAIFSLNDTLGPREAKYGWVDGYVIQGGKLKKELAGGISQSATTTYNAGFFAGLKDVEHHPHSLYFDRYPAGRESTIYYGALDMRFQNDTPYGVLMQAFVKKAAPGVPGSITVRVWSTKYHQIKTATPTKSDFTSGRTITDDSPDCEYQAPIQGFTARFYRAFIVDGKEVRRENYVWKYDPGDEIRCT